MVGQTAVAPRKAERRGLAQLWQAHPSIRGAAAQRRARLASILLLCLVAVGTLATVLILSGAIGGTAADFVLSIGAVTGLLLALALVWLGRVGTGSVTAILVLDMTLCAWRVATTGELGPVVLYFLGVPLLVAGLVLPVGIAVGFWAVTLAAAMGLEALLGAAMGARLNEPSIVLGIYLLAMGALSVAAASIMQRDARLLDEGAAQLRQLAEKLPQVFFILSPDLRVPIFISPAYERVWGRKVEQFLVDPFDWTKGVHPADHGRVMAALQESPFGTLEYRIVQPGGAVRQIRSRTFPVHDERGTIIRMVGVAEDITDDRPASGGLQDAG